MLQTISEGQANVELPINENFASLEHVTVYGTRPAATTGLVWGYYGGRWGGILVNDGTLTLAANSDNYIVVDRSNGNIELAIGSPNAWNDADNYARVYKFTTNSTAIIGTVDHRVGSLGILGGGTGGGGGGGGGGGSFVGCRAYNDGAQSLTSGTAAAVTMNTEEFDTSSVHSTSSNTSRFTIPVGLDGKWRFSYKIGFRAAAAGQRIIFLRKNGGTDANNIIGSYAAGYGNSTYELHMHGTVTIGLVAGDYVELFAYQDSGGALNIGYPVSSNRGHASSMEAEFLGA